MARRQPHTVSGLARRYTGRYRGCGEKWFRDLDSNQDTQLQRLMSYRLDDPGNAFKSLHWRGRCCNLVQRCPRFVPVFFEERGELLASFKHILLRRNVVAFEDAARKMTTDLHCHL